MKPNPNFKNSVSGELRTRYLSRWNGLKTERASFMAHYQEISDFTMPRSGQFFISDVNRGDKRHNAIYDSEGTQSLRILAAGMMSGMTSPARPWFKVAVADPELMKFHSVKVWCDEVTKIMLRIFHKSNTYRSLHSMYEELGAFGTAASVVMDDFQDVIRHHTLTVGEYCLAKNYRGDIDAMYREFQMTVAQLVKEFGEENCSPNVKNMFREGNLDAWIPVIHLIEPREDRQFEMLDDQNMPFKSVYFEYNGNTDQVLRVSGYKRFPVLAPRWSAKSGDVYGGSPTMDTLGDIKQLQHQQLRKGEVIDKQTDPPLQVPTHFQGRFVDSLPGGVNFYDANSAQGGIRTAYDVRLDLSHLTLDIQDVRQRIRSGLYADLFLMLSQDRSGQKTAYEVAERHEEKLLMIGPVLERLHDELLNKKIDITFSRGLEVGIFPPPPEEMQGQELQVEFVSVLAQAQKAIGVNGLNSFVMSIGQIAQFVPSAMQKIDGERMVDVYADMYGVDPTLVVSGEQLAIIKKVQAQNAAQQQRMAMAQQAASAAKDASQANTGEKNALTDVMNMFSGYTGSGG